MDLQDLPIFVILAILAEVIGTIGGFGSSVFFVPMASYFMAFKTVLGLTALFHLSSNFSKIVLFRKGFDKNLVLYLGIPAVFFVIAGSLLSRYVKGEILNLALGIFLILFSLLFLIKKDLEISPTKKNAFAGGVFSGFIAGLLGTGGAIRGATLSAYNLKKDKFIATSAIIDMGVDLSRSVVYTTSGYIGWSELYLVPILFLVGVAGTYIGKRLLVGISQQLFKKIVLLLLFGIGVSTLVLASARY
ncbi:sulfite exporter TauE/SafE family protein [Zeaxanthinibacter sp. PT1]|uniref:sulfite exporter TauE/SafE family protein n=1 Tax=Zeaxanthinibacter TaxID=561554 RepID=UPI00234BC656|nr:sulfite exporter TauE/SafE family protein [Zeaxanthinibacter sp. PT1]MDC6351922.1 sulfite exporter TauE/SafE family protein [Zeaxanthinibacter sp. PT1]